MIPDNKFACDCYGKGSSNNRRFIFPIIILVLVVLAVGITLGILFGIIFGTIAKGCASLSEIRSPGSYQLMHDNVFAKIYITPIGGTNVLGMITYVSTPPLLSIDVNDKDGLLSVSSGKFETGSTPVLVHVS
jgi:hypothetical protein